MVTGFQRLWDITLIRGSRDFELRARLFRFVFAAFAQPTVAILAEALRISKDRYEQYPGPEYVLRMCSSLLHVDKDSEKVEFRHLSAQHLVRRLDVDQKKAAKEGVFGCQNPR